MIVIPQPMISGATNADKLNQIVEYLFMLTNIINEAQISSDNLGQALREKIDSGITEHQDLSHMSTNTHTAFAYAIWFFRRLLGGI